MSAKTSLRRDEMSPAGEAPLQGENSQLDIYYIVQVNIVLIGSSSIKDGCRFLRNAIPDYDFQAQRHFSTPPAMFSCLLTWRHLDPHIRHS